MKRMKKDNTQVRKLRVRKKLVKEVREVVSTLTNQWDKIGQWAKPKDCNKFNRLMARIQKNTEGQLWTQINKTIIKRGLVYQAYRK